MLPLRTPLGRRNLRICSRQTSFTGRRVTLESPVRLAGICFFVSKFLRRKPECSHGVRGPVFLSRAFPGHRLRLLSALGNTSACLKILQGSAVTTPQGFPRRPARCNFTCDSLCLSLSRLARKRPSVIKGNAQNLGLYLTQTQEMAAANAVNPFDGTDEQVGSYCLFVCAGIEKIHTCSQLLNDAN